jgi:hypothetical protein
MTNAIVLDTCISSPLIIIGKSFKHYFLSFIMQSLPEDLLLYLSKFLDHISCCKLSGLHNLSLTNKTLFSLYKEKFIIYPTIPFNQHKKFYRKTPHYYKTNCYLCGPFNKKEFDNIISTINKSYTKEYPARPKQYWPTNLSSSIHFDTSFEMGILKTKTDSLGNYLTFIIAGKCCDGAGATLYIKI